MSEELKQEDIKTVENLDSQSKIKDLESEVKELTRELKRESRATKAAAKFESELKEQKRELDSIIDTHMLYVVVNKDLEVKEVSKAFIDKLGYSEEYLKECGYNILIEYSDLEKFFNGCEYVSNNGTEACGTDLKMMRQLEGCLLKIKALFDS